MTDTQQNLTQKKLDLKFYYKLAEEAAQAYDIDQALKISQDGLKYAQTQDKVDWVEKFDALNSQLSQPSPDQNRLTPSIVKEDFTIIKGVGPAVAKKLNDGKINSIAVLAKTPPKTLASSIAGIGVATAQKIVSSAKDYLSLKKLNDFSQSDEDSNDHHIQGDVNENLKREYNSLKYKENPEIKAENSKSSNKDPWFEEKFNYSRLGRSYDMRKQDINLSEVEDTEDTEINGINEINSEINTNVDSEVINNLEITQVQDFIDSKGVIERKSNVIEEQDLELGKENAVALIQDEHETYKENLSYQNLNRLTDEIIGEVRSCDFDIIDKTPDLREIHDGIEMVAIKPIHIHEFLDLLLLIPIKICTLKGSLIVSEDKIDYKAKEHKENNFHIDRIPLSYMKTLEKARKVIFDDIVNRGKFSKHLEDHLNTSIFVKKTINHKVLFLHSGQRQYKLLIEPLIICQNSVGFIEKVIPFAYQKFNNFHVVSISQLTAFLEYIDQKYIVSEEYNEQKPAYKVYYIAKDKFWQNMRNVGFPFLLYSLVFIFIFIFQQYSALSLLINLGFGLIGLLSIIIGYIFLKFYNIKVNLHQDFVIPYHQKSYSFDETSLTLIKDKLKPKLMEQFTYEWLGKNNSLNVVEKIELKNAERYLCEKVMNKNVKKADLFETQNEKMNSPEDFERKNQYVQKYSSFLED